VPIVLATFPVLAGAPGGDRIFHLVFFIVVMNAIVPAPRSPGHGASGSSPRCRRPQAVLAIESRLPLKGELMSFYIDEALVVTG
jgi:cell volume regulation protein A